MSFWVQIRNQIWCQKMGDFVFLGILLITFDLLHQRSRALLPLTVVCCSFSWVRMVGSSLLLAMRSLKTCSLYLVMMSSNADWCSSKDVRSSAWQTLTGLVLYQGKVEEQIKGSEPQTLPDTPTDKQPPLFSCCSSRIWRFSCWIPNTRLERGRCRATWFSPSISSWYCKHRMILHIWFNRERNTFLFFCFNISLIYWL